MKRSELIENKRLKQIPRISRYLPFDRFSRKYLKRSHMLTMQRNRVVVDLTGAQSEWLAENCQDIYTSKVRSQYGNSCEVMFLSPEDMSLFLLKYA